MSSLDPESVILNVPSGSSLDTRLQEIDVPTIVCTDITVNGTFNGTPVVGTIVFTDSTQTITHKSLSDTTTFIVDAVDPTIRAQINAAGAPGTTGTILLAQTANRTYTVPDSGASASFVMTEGDQTINGNKTFSNLTIGGTLSLGTNHIIYSSGAVSTTDATATALYTLSTQSNYMYLLTAQVVGGTSAGVTTVYRFMCKAKNIAGAVTLGTPFDSWDDADAALATASAAFAVSGTNILLNVIGVAATNLTWKGTVESVTTNLT